MAQNYDGFYAEFEAFSKNDAGILSGADTIVGDDFGYELIEREGKRVAALKNKFDMQVGYFDEATTRRIQLAKAREWNIRILLSFVAYSSEPEPGHYWGGVCILAYANSCKEEFDVFTAKIAGMLAEGLRPEVSLETQAYNQVIAAKGDWEPKDRVPMPKNKEDMALIKSKRTMSEGLIEQGRKGNVGCYIVSYAFIIIVIAVIVFIVLLLTGVISF